MDGEIRACVGVGWRAVHEAELLARPGQVDFIEVHSENFFADGGVTLATLLKARQDQDVSLHGVGLALGSAAGLDAWHLARLARLAERVEPRWVSDHAAFARGPLPELPGSPKQGVIHAADLLPVAFTPASLALMVRHVEQVQDLLRRPILVENLSAYLAWDDGQQMAEPEFFNQLAHRSGCGLLLDVNNLVVNALNRAEADPVAAACAWIDALDPAIVGEIHLAGYHDDGDLIIDDHGSQVHPPVWAVYSHALRRLGPVPTLIEWDTRLPAWEVLLGEAAQARRLIGERWAGGMAQASVVSGKAGFTAVRDADHAR